MAVELLNQPVQETGTDHDQMVKGGHTSENSVAIESLDDKDETTPVEDNERSPEVWSASSGIGGWSSPVIKVSVETQTEAEPPNQSPDVKPELLVESDIKEMSTPTPTGAHDKLPPGHNLTGKKKKTRPRKRRQTSKGRKDTNLIPSSDDPQSRILGLSGNIMTLASKLILFYLICTIGVTQASADNNVGGDWNCYSFSSNTSLVGVDLTIKNKTKVLCEINAAQTHSELTGNQQEMHREFKKIDCKGSSVFLINKTALILVTKEGGDSYFVEPEGMKRKYEGLFRDPESALEKFHPKAAGQAGPTESPPDGLLWWKPFVGILAVILAAVVVTLVVMKFRHRCPVKKASPPSAEMEMENLRTDQYRDRTHGYV